MHKAHARVWPIVLSALTGVSAWISMGGLAVTDAATNERVAALPPLWLLAVLVVLAIALAHRLRLSHQRAWPLAISFLLWLPYLPGRVPDAFLIWQGPIEWAVWCAVIAGTIGGGPLSWPRGVGSLVAEPRRAPWVAAMLAATGYVVGAVATADRIPSGDEPHYLVITQSLFLDRDLMIENNHNRGDYAPYFMGELKPHYLRRGLNGQIYSVHAPGVSVLILPAFALAGYPGAAATVIATTAMASALAWSAAWLLTTSASAAWVGWAAVFLTTPFFFNGFTIYPDGIGGVFTMAGVWLLVQLERQRPVSRLTLLLVGAALSVLPWLHTRFAILAGTLGVCVGMRLATETSGRVRRTLTFLAIPVLSAAAWFGFFWTIWGTPNPSAPYGGNTQIALGQIWRGASGLLVDQQFGVFSNAPVYATAFAGLILLARRHPRLAGELFVVVVSYAAAASSYAMWWGGVSAPARFVSAVLPVAALPIAWWWQAQSSTGWRGLTLLLLLASLVVVVPRLAVDHGVLIYNSRDGFDLLLDWAARSVNMPMAFPSLHRGTLAESLSDAAVWAAAGVLLAVVAHVLTRRGARGRGAVWATMVVAAATVSMAASTIVWARHGETGATPNTSQLAFLRGWDPDTQTTGLLLRPFRRLDFDDLSRRIEVATNTRGAPNTAAAGLFSSSMLPAADYDVVAAGSNMLAGELAVRIGRTDQVTERWTLTGLRPGLTGLTLHLPVPVHSVNVRGEEGGMDSVARLSLRLRRLLPDSGLRGAYARRAARYGRVRAFFLDDAAFAEAPGFWTRGAESTSVVLDADADDTTAPRGLLVRVRSGPVPTDVDLTVGDWTERLSLAPDQRQDVTLPPRVGRDPWALTIRTGAKFSPREFDAQNKDFRRLGVWVEFP